MRLVSGATEKHSPCFPVICNRAKLAVLSGWDDLSPVSHKDTSHSWASLSLCMQKRVESLGVSSECSTLPCDVAQAAVWLVSHVLKNAVISLHLPRILVVM